MTNRAIVAYALLVLAAVAATLVAGLMALWYAAAAG